MPPAGGRARRRLAPGQPPGVNAGAAAWPHRERDRSRFSESGASGTGRRWPNPSPPLAEGHGPPRSGPKLLSLRGEAGPEWPGGPAAATPARADGWFSLELDAQKAAAAHWYRGSRRGGGLTVRAHDSGALSAGRPAAGPGCGDPASTVNTDSEFRVPGGDTAWTRVFTGPWAFRVVGPIPRIMTESLS